VFRNQFQKHFQTKKTQNWILQRISSKFSRQTISKNKHLNRLTVLYSFIIILSFFLTLFLSFLIN
jgi:hypothetical protein